MLDIFQEGHFSLEAMFSRGAVVQQIKMSRGGLFRCWIQKWGSKLSIYWVICTLVKKSSLVHHKSQKFTKTFFKNCKKNLLEKYCLPLASGKCFLIAIYAVGAEIQAILPVKPAPRTQAFARISDVGSSYLKIVKKWVTNNRSAFFQKLTFIPHRLY